MAESLVETIWFLQISDLKPAVILNLSFVTPEERKKKLGVYVSHSLSFSEFWSKIFIRNIPNA